MRMTIPGACAVAGALNEGDTIQNVLRQLARAGIERFVLVANGCSDETVTNAKRIAQDLCLEWHVEVFGEPLGPDVSRAVGAYSALRRFPDVQWLVFVDSDWRGSFGPDLARLVLQSIARQTDVTWVNGDSKTGAPHEREDLALWREAQRRFAPHLVGASPSQLPMVVCARTFRFVPPHYLSHPGLWFALCVQQGERLRTAASSWNALWLGNPVRSRAHAMKMAHTLYGDALEGTRVLRNLKPTRHMAGMDYDGYASQRRIDLMSAFAARCEYIGQPPSKRRTNPV